MNKMIKIKFSTINFQQMIVLIQDSFKIKTFKVMFYYLPQTHFFEAFYDFF